MFHVPLNKSKGILSCFASRFFISLGKLSNSYKFAIWIWRIHVCVCVFQQLASVSLREYHKSTLCSKSDFVNKLLDEIRRNPPVHTEYSCLHTPLSIFFCCYSSHISYCVVHYIPFKPLHIHYHCIDSPACIVSYHIIRKIYVILSLVFNIGKQYFIFSLSFSLSFTIS